jgi:L,D-peptidoglycan transpeptidase YkuD (ErfK/YbiS/YcfS/YnhG family)
LFIFTTDNGYMMGEHRYSGKILGYEPSLRVPLLMRGPGIPVGKTVSSTVGLVDIAPTIAEVTQAQPMLTQDGRSVLGVANGTEPGYDAISIEAGPQTDAEKDGWLYQGVRTKRYTFMEYPTTDEFELYDRLVDPYELNNVAYRPTYAATRSTLAGMLSKLRACVGEQCRTVGGPVPPPVPDGTPIHPDELGSIGTATQVVTLTASTWSTQQGTAVAWQKVGHTWRIARGPFPVTLGTNGMVGPGRARQLTGKVPAGSFRPSSAFGLNPDPGTTLRYRQFDENDYWPYDPASKSTYNVLQVSRSAKATWRSSLAERWWAHRFRYPSALIVDQNLPSGITWSTRFHERVASATADPTQGSFVVHSGAAIGKNGWVSMHPAQVRWLLGWMRPRAQGTRLVVGTPAYLRANL